MLINLLKTKSVLSTIEKNTDRHIRFKSIMDRLGFENWKQYNGEIIKPYSVGVAKTLKKALLDNLEEPFIFFEDDANVTEAFKFMVEVPDGCQSLYLGTSVFGMIRGQSVMGGIICSNYNDEYVKPYNMLAFHSILFLDKEYKLEVIKLMDEFIKNPIGGSDELVASNMHKYNILAVRKPMFYQNDGHSEQATLQPLEPLF
jgi:hypothetical protein